MDAITLQANFNKYDELLKTEGRLEAQKFLLGLPFGAMRSLAEKLLWERNELVFKNFQSTFNEWADLITKGAVEA